MRDKQLIHYIARDAHIDPLRAEVAVQAIWSSMREAVRGGQILRVRGFGTFRPATWRGRKLTNQKQQSFYDVGDRKSVRFRPSPQLKAEVLRTTEKDGRRA